MAKDIYELFNQRLNGIEPYDSIEEGLNVLSTLDKEFTQTMIELEVAQYLDSLIIESIMYESFDEEKLSYTIEATEEKQKGSILQTLQTQWEKIKQWFINITQTITNFFVNGEKLVKENRDKIPNAIKNCNVKVKMNEYNPQTGLSAKVLSLSTKIKSLATKEGMTKESLLSQLGVEDKKGMENVVKKLIVKTEGKEMMVSDIDPNIAMDYVGNKKAILDSIDKDKKDIDAMFKDAINVMKSKDATEKQKAMLPVFHFAVSLKNGLTSAYIGYVRKACNDYLTVIRKALGSDKKEGKEDGKVNMEHVSGVVKKYTEQKNVRALRSALGTMIYTDKDFSKGYVKSNINYITKHGIEIWEDFDPSIPLFLENKKDGFDENDFVDSIVNLEKNFSKKRLHEVEVIGKAVYGGKNKAKEEPEEKKGKFGFGKKEKKFKEKDKKFGNGVKLTDAFYKAVNDKKERLLRIMIADAMLYEKGEGPTVKQMLKEIKKAKLNIYGKDDFDGRETDKSKWDKDYLNKVHIKFKSNGSESLYKHAVAVTTYYYKHKEEAKMESFLASIGLLDDDEE